MFSLTCRRVTSSLLRSNIPVRAMSSGAWGEGVGHGGGSGGSIRDAGGAFGKREAVLEEKYFREKEAEQFKEMKEHMENEISMHEQSIRIHQEAIERHKKKMAEIDQIKHDKK